VIKDWYIMEQITSLSGYCSPTHGFSVSAPNAANSDKTRTYENGKSRATAPATDPIQENPDLEQINTAWPGLPDHIKKYIVSERPG